MDGKVISHGCGGGVWTFFFSFKFKFKEVCLKMSNIVTFSLDSGIMAMNTINNENLLLSKYVSLPQFFISHDKSSWSKFSESSKIVQK